MKIGMFIDTSNLFSATRKYLNGGIDYEQYKIAIEEGEGGEVTRAIMYGFQDLRGNMHKFILSVQDMGYETKYVQFAGPSYGFRWDVTMIVDIMRYMDNFDTIVIGSNDFNLTPVVQAIKDRGKKCIIFACGVPKQLQQLASSVYEVGEYDLIIEQVIKSSDAALKSAEERTA